MRLGDRARESPLAVDAAHRADSRSAARSIHRSLRRHRGAEREPVAAAARARPPRAARRRFERSVSPTSGSRTSSASARPASRCIGESGPWNANGETRRERADALRERTSARPAGVTRTLGQIARDSSPTARTSVTATAPSSATLVLGESVGEDRRAAVGAEARDLAMQRRGRRRRAPSRVGCGDLRSARARPDGTRRRRAWSRPRRRSRSRTRSR